MKIVNPELLNYIQSVSGKDRDATLKIFSDNLARALSSDSPPAPDLPPESQFRAVLSPGDQILAVLSPGQPADDLSPAARAVPFDAAACLQNIAAAARKKFRAPRENKELLMFIQSISQDKDLPYDEVVAIFADSLAQSLHRTASGLLFPSGRREPDRMEGQFRVTIDPANGAMALFRLFRVVADDQPIENPQYEIMGDNEIALVCAGLAPPDSDGRVLSRAAPDEIVEWPLLNPSFDMRACFQVAKQALNLRIRDAERGRLLDELLARGDDLLIGPVIRLTRDHGDAIMEVMKVECRLPRREMIPRENIKIGDRVKALTKEVNRELRGPQVMVTRNSPDFLIRLFQREVPEMEKGILEVVNAVRDPGNRAKIAVRSHDARVDPVGTCVGIRGSRVQNVTNELNGERIDIVHWDADEETYVLRALAPAEASKVEVDADNKCMNVLVESEKLAQAIGKSGVNVRLAADLTGWRLNLKTPEEFSEELEEETLRKSRALMEKLDVDENVARILFEEGFETMEHVAYVPPSELCDIEGFDEPMVREIQSRAKAAAERHEAEISEKLGRMAADLSELDGMDEELLRALAANDIMTLQDLADLSSGELREFSEIDSERAGDIIMRARDITMEDDDDNETSGESPSSIPETQPAQPAAPAASAAAATDSPDK